MTRGRKGKPKTISADIYAAVDDYTITYEAMG